MPSDPYTDDEYDDTYKKVHGDEGAREQHTSDGTDDTFFPSGLGGTLSPSAWGGTGQGPDTVDAEYGERGERKSKTREGHRTDEDDSWVDEGLIGLVLVAGIALFLFPEPTTSAIGIGLITVGAIAWIIDWLG